MTLTATASCVRTALRSAVWRCPAPVLALSDGWERESQAFLADRDWHAVCSALRASVLEDAPLPGDSHLPSLPSLPPRVEPPERSPPNDKLRRITWALSLSYFGPGWTSFTWQAEAPETTVVGCVQLALAPLLERGGRSTSLRTASAGRTDAGVSAVNQLLTFTTWVDLTAAELHAAVDAAAPGRLRLRRATRVDRSFHATFSAHWRRYAYFLPARDGDGVGAEELHAVLQPLVGAARDYSALGRKVPSGKSGVMTVLSSAASPVTLPGGGAATRIDVVGDRFLRRQVRVLVATAVHAARAYPDEPDALLRLASSRDQLLTAPAAPAYGLVFAEPGYREFS